MTIKFENFYECEKISSNLLFENIYEYEKVSSNLLFENIIKFVGWKYLKKYHKNWYTNGAPPRGAPYGPC